VGIADRAGDTNKTLVLRCVREDGLIIQPDRPATHIDAMFFSGGALAEAPRGMIWNTHASVAGLTWHYLLSIDLMHSWRLSEDDFYPRVTASDGWVLRQWHRVHQENSCEAGADAVESGCVQTVIRRPQDLPSIRNRRPIMVQNDSYTFDLWQLAPIGPNGWIILGDTSRYVSVSSKRIHGIDYSGSCARASVVGSQGEHIVLTALQPRSPDAPGHVKQWTVVTRKVLFSSTSSVEAVEFCSEDALLV